MSGTQPTEARKSSSSSSNNNDQEWWLPSFPRWNYWNFFMAGPGNDLIGLLASNVVDGMNQHLDPEGPFIQKLLDQHLPSDKEAVREKLPFYDATIASVKHQRDVYLLGDAHKQKDQLDVPNNNDRIAKRFVFPLGATSRSSQNTPKMPLDATALGYTQIVNLGSWFVPSATIKESLLPIVVGLPSNSLRDTITSTVTNAIPLAQPPLDAAMKNAVMGVIQDPQIREMIKSRTQKILRTDDDFVSKASKG